MLGASHVKVADAMNTRPFSVPPSMLVRECARLMRERDVGSVIVESQGTLRGFLTEQGLVHKIVARGHDPNEVRVSEVMLTQIETIEPEADLREAMRRMAQKDIRQLPVVDDGRLVGLLTRTDILKIQPALIDIAVEHIALASSLPEGRCEQCGSHGLLHEHDGERVCASCRLD